MFRRGFKSWCEKRALEYRQDLGIHPVESLSPLALARYLSKVVWTPHDIPDFDPKIAQKLCSPEHDTWSAVTVCAHGLELVILNSSHSSQRQANDLMHELSHVIIGHTPSRVDLTEDNLLVLNTYDKQQENEANWLAGALLAPRPALLYIASRKMSLAQGASWLGVSKQLLSWRLNVTGVRSRVASV